MASGWHKSKVGTAVSSCNGLLILDRTVCFNENIFHGYATTLLSMLMAQGRETGEEKCKELGCSTSYPEKSP